eukprot:TRINITY_DN93648_c0_g1_i1.p1 TRINITY_DN93648_c0_g1~~TRINITY_DN93648_c0_g1_i1.p1  ORF type:complete len:535 (-),score=163.17 TRINITY_DN93648_c0_g1_i1:97-1632(-)
MLRLFLAWVVIALVAVPPSAAVRVDDDLDDALASESATVAADANDPQKALERAIFIAIFRWTDQNGDGYAQRADIDRLNKAIQGAARGRPLSDAQWSRAAKEIGFDPGRGVNLAQFVASHYGTGSLEEDYRRLGIRDPTVEQLLVKYDKASPVSKGSGVLPLPSAEALGGVVSRTQPIAPSEQKPAGAAAPPAAAIPPASAAPLAKAAAPASTAATATAATGAVAAAAAAATPPKASLWEFKPSKKKKKKKQQEPAEEKTPKKPSKKPADGTPEGEEKKKKRDEIRKRLGVRVDGGDKTTEMIKEVQDARRMVKQARLASRRARAMKAAEASNESLTAPHAAEAESFSKEVDDARQLVQEAHLATQRARELKVEAAKVQDSRQERAGSDDSQADVKLVNQMKDTLEYLKKDEAGLKSYDDSAWKESQNDAQHGAGSAISVRGLLRPDLDSKEDMKGLELDTKRETKKTKKCKKRKKKKKMKSKTKGDVTTINVGSSAAPEKSTAWYDLRFW